MHLSLPNWLATSARASSAVSLHKCSNIRVPFVQQSEPLWCDAAKVMNSFVRANNGVPITKHQVNIICAFCLVSSIYFDKIYLSDQKCWALNRRLPALTRPIVQFAKVWMPRLDFLSFSIEFVKISHNRRYWKRYY